MSEHSLTSDQLIGLEKTGSQSKVSSKRSKKQGIESDQTASHMQFDLVVNSVCTESIDFLNNLGLCGLFHYIVCIRNE